MWGKKADIEKPGERAGIRQETIFDDFRGWSSVVSSESFLAQVKVAQPWLGDEETA